MADFKGTEPIDDRQRRIINEAFAAAEVVLATDPADALENFGEDGLRAIRDFIDWMEAVEQARKDASN